MQYYKLDKLKNRRANSGTGSKFLLLPVSLLSATFEDDVQRVKSITEFELRRLLKYFQFFGQVSVSLLRYIIIFLLQQLLLGFRLNFIFYV
jgi:hypothetical protein